MPQAIEWSFATPKISALRPSSSPIRGSPRAGRSRPVHPPTLVPRIMPHAAARDDPLRAARAARSGRRAGHPDVVDARLDERGRTRVGRLEPDPDRLAGPCVHVDGGRAPAPAGERGRPPLLPDDGLRRRRRPRRSPGGGPRPTSRDPCAKNQRKVSFWPAAAGSAIRAERIVVRPSRSSPSAGSRRPRARSRTRIARTTPVPAGSSCRRRSCRAGSPRANRPAAGAVSVPSGLTAQPRATSRSSSKAPQRAVAHGGPEHRQRAPRPLHQVQHGLLVASGLGGDHRVLRVVDRRHLDRVREDPVAPVLRSRATCPRSRYRSLACSARVAVRRGHVLADRSASASWSWAVMSDGTLASV